MTKTEELGEESQNGYYKQQLPTLTTKLAVSEAGVLVNKSVLFLSVVEEFVLYKCFMR